MVRKRRRRLGADEMPMGSEYGMTMALEQGGELTISVAVGARGPVCEIAMRGKDQELDMETKVRLSRIEFQRLYLILGEAIMQDLYP